MAYLIALLLPPLAVVIKGRIGLGLVLLLLQLTVLGWVPAALVALLVVHDANRSKALRQLRAG